MRQVTFQTGNSSQAEGPQCRSAVFRALLHSGRMPIPQGLSTLSSTLCAAYTMNKSPLQSSFAPQDRCAAPWVAKHKRRFEHFYKVTFHPCFRRLVDPPRIHCTSVGAQVHLRAEAQVHDLEHHLEVRRGRHAAQADRVPPGVRDSLVNFKNVSPKVCTRSETSAECQERSSKRPNVSY